MRRLEKTKYGECCKLNFEFYEMGDYLLGSTVEMFTEKQNWKP